MLASNPKPEGETMKSYERYLKSLSPDTIVVVSNEDILGPADEPAELIELKQFFGIPAGCRQWSVSAEDLRKLNAAECAA